ncbi:MAG TPA: glycosyltransferase family 4 protein [Vicinamibacteria bacterium]|nr:glycosyltransferase family 4 protein [Vicinamibacteria bacterium]
MKLLMVTPHLPPHQAANALLPHQLGCGLRERGHEVRFLTFGAGPDRDGVAFVRRRSRRLRTTRVPQALEAMATWRKGSPLVRAADVVHVHSNTWMNQVAAGLAARHGRPYVLTHYGTEIWHHDGKDAAFRRMNARARHVTFYSQALLERARELALPLSSASVVYPPVAESFAPRTDAERQAVRRQHLPEGQGALIVNVKRLHPLADHATLLDAFALVRRERGDARLAIAGSGETGPALRAQAARLGLDETVTFLGLVPNEALAPLQAAADLFVLSSILEATPTVALEALASGTPVVSTDNPGGLELRGLFGDDVVVVPRRDPAALAQAILAGLREPRRTRPASARLVAERFRLPGVVETYLRLYAEAGRR